MAEREQTRDATLAYLIEVLHRTKRLPKYKQFIQPRSAKARSGKPFSSAGFAADMRSWAIASGGRVISKKK